MNWPASLRFVAACAATVAPARAFYRAPQEALRRTTPFFATTVVLIATSCLITEPPQFKPPTHTAPFVLDATAFPDPYRILILDDAQRAETVEFSANVVSQDEIDPASPFHTLTARLYVDLGRSDTREAFRWAIAGSVVAPGSIDQTAPRRVSAGWSVDVNPVSPGCHTATLMVSHEFDDASSGCPVCMGDATSITWIVLRCDSSLGTCTSLAVAPCTTVVPVCTSARACSPVDGGAP